MFAKAYITRKLSLSLGLVASIVALATQPALAFDGRSPDTRDAAAARAVVVSDVRSPDTQYAAKRAAQDSIASDMRDAASRAVPPTPVASPTPTSAGFDWDDFAIGLGTGLGAILMLALLAALAVTSRAKRRGSSYPATT